MVSRRDGIRVKVTQAKVSVGKAARSIDELNHLLQFIPNKMKTRELRTIVRAGGTQIVKAARKIVPIGTGRRVDADGNIVEYTQLKDTLAQKVTGRSSKGTAVSIQGSRSGQAPQAHLVHEGTRPHIIRAGVRTSPRGQTRPTGKRALSNRRRFFGSAVNHPGAKPFPYLEKALQRSRGIALKKMGDKAAQRLKKLVGEA